MSISHYSLLAFGNDKLTRSWAFLQTQAGFPVIFQACLQYLTSSFPCPNQSWVGFESLFRSSVFLPSQTAWRIQIVEESVEPTVIYQNQICGNIQKVLIDCLKNKRFYRHKKVLTWQGPLFVKCFPDGSKIINFVPENISITFPKWYNDKSPPSLQ